ncbi:TPA: hypothetical protein R1X36_001893 [Campylobacter upsaliensis]|nr:hypothetical protein [Campylobacter upsaliensis]
MENDGFVKDANAESMENKSVDNGEKKPLSGINSHIYNKEFFSNKKFIPTCFFENLLFVSLRFKAKN